MKKLESFLCPEILVPSLRFSLKLELKGLWRQISNLRAFATPVEDVYSSPSTLIRQLTATSRGSDALFWLLRTPSTHVVPRHTSGKTFIYIKHSQYKIELRR